MPAGCLGSLGGIPDPVEREDFADLRVEHTLPNQFRDLPEVHEGTGDRSLSHPVAEPEPFDDRPSRDHELGSIWIGSPESVP